MWDWFQEWLKQPFKSDMNATHWLLFIGLVIIAAWGWRELILRHILAGVE